MGTHSERSRPSAVTCGVGVKVEVAVGVALGFGVIVGVGVRVGVGDAVGVWVTVGVRVCVAVAGSTRATRRGRWSRLLAGVKAATLRHRQTPIAARIVGITREAGGNVAADSGRAASFVIAVVLEVPDSAEFSAPGASSACVVSGSVMAGRITCSQWAVNSPVESGARAL